MKTVADRTKKRIKVNPRIDGMRLLQKLEVLFRTLEARLQRANLLSQRNERSFREFAVCYDNSQSCQQHNAIVLTYSCLRATLARLAAITLFLSLLTSITSSASASARARDSDTVLTVCILPRLRSFHRTGITRRKKVNREASSDIPRNNG